MGGRRGRKKHRTRTVTWLTAIVFFVGMFLLTFHILAAGPVGLLGKLDVHYVIVDMAGGGYRVSPAIATGPSRMESFSSMIQRLKPHAAICGTYYDPDRKPLGDIVINGKVVVRGCQRQGIGFTSNGGIRFLERRGRGRIDWSGCRSGIACGPRLVRGGKRDIDVRRDGFSAAANTTKARRCAVGATVDGKLILCVVLSEVSLSTMANVMIELGARDAINLDGGGMCALYTDGTYHAQPVISMSNILAVYKAK